MLAARSSFWALGGQNVARKTADAAHVTNRARNESVGPKSRPLAGRAPISFRAAVGLSPQHGV
jgi:hypothetical protein